MAEHASSMVQESRAWIFVAHSHRDLVPVRRIRNALEAVGAQPLLFFLKCLTDDDEVDELIKREIDARNFFLLCESAHANGSRWVPSERAYAEQSRKRIETINLDGEWRKQLRGIQALVRDATIFCSYARHDEAQVRPVQSALSDLDYAVWVDSGSGEAIDNLERALRAAAKKGFLLHFLSPESLRSLWVRQEISFFVRRAGWQRYIPIALTSDVGGDLPDELARVQVLDYSSGDVHRLLPQLLASLRRAWPESGGRRAT